MSKSRQLLGLQRLVSDQDAEICSLKNTNNLRICALKIAQEQIQAMKNCENCKRNKSPQYKHCLSGDMYCYEKDYPLWEMKE